MKLILKHKDFKINKITLDVDKKKKLYIKIQ